MTSKKELKDSELKDSELKKRVRLSLDTEILEKICEINEGSSGGHPGAAGYNGTGDTEAIIEIAKQESIDKINQLS